MPIKRPAQELALLNTAEDSLDENLAKIDLLNERLEDIRRRYCDHFYRQFENRAEFGEFCRLHWGKKIQRSGLEEAVISEAIELLENVSSD